jgi:hypothetical protein
MPKVARTEYNVLLLKAQTTVPDASRRQMLHAPQNGVRRTVLVDRRQRGKLARALPKPPGGSANLQHTIRTVQNFALV